MDEVEIIPEEKQLVESGPYDCLVTFDQLSLCCGGDISSCLCALEPPVMEVLNDKGLVVHFPSSPKWNIVTFRYHHTQGIF